MFEIKISAETKNYIQRKLKELEEEHNVVILFAVESGSRAWGFPSKNSDYDVRFVYRRNIKDYLSVKKFRDVIEYDIIEDDFLNTPLDLNGWDIKKALSLALQSNSVLIEWLNSPVVYAKDEEISNKILEFSRKVANIDLIKKHYYKTSYISYKQIKENINSAKLKLYCYAIRPVLAYLWVNKFNETPPMDMNSLLGKLQIQGDLLKEIENLINLKLHANEGDLIPRNLIIDNFIESLLVSEPEKIIHPEMESDKADELFREIIYWEK